MKLLLKIKYDGSNFFGYQVQPQKRTVQAVLGEAARNIYGVECNITGCSRTDSGVHALSFYATVEPKTNINILIPEDRAVYAFNSNLPGDISVIKSQYVTSDFHPRYDVISKEYTYKIYNAELRDPFLRNYAYHYKKHIDDTGIDRMNKAAEHIIGTHDFSSFMAEGSSVKDAVRNVHSLTACREGDFIVIKISGNGFLYNMVRIISGTLLLCGTGKISASDIEGIINAKDRSFAGQTLSPCGLYLTSVSYPKFVEI